jgi:hypothetical protein
MAFLAKKAAKFSFEAGGARRTVDAFCNMSQNASCPQPEGLVV